jgi:hypothetical protein
MHHFKPLEIKYFMHFVTRNMAKLLHFSGLISLCFKFAFLREKIYFEEYLQK